MDQHPERTPHDSRKSDHQSTAIPSGGQSEVEAADLETAKRFDAARGGSRSAMGELFETCRNYLLLVANISVGDDLRARVAASDLVQETFLEAGEIFERFTGSSTEELLRWLTRILENKLGNAVKRHLRAAKRDASREVQLGGDTCLLDGFRDELCPPPSDILADHEEGDRIHAVVLQLPFDYRQVIDLRVNQALSYAQVGRAMNRTGDAARKLFVRAIDDLRSRMRADDQAASQR
ncbi:MAG TPA: sigma-70 family RNA polymerase sigma factor [Planctomycetaceae bacterium]|jgi:RNA polymerase sigma-70 factor (ECF subfamily)|nr:sigma-70 family RNA polymerase sigma factor [Planctomycetaceae bacterium]